ncbi:hypothetical protein EG68_07447 [Paragonimus skrjabini miyazakii]|uniref:Uncharacterized protein n=1 Tax=Paragonimus skrjabini miyazakii TaxID=59628 RepID=A0A8S9YLY8_9TREM|nr:hypothetical protein EG68_07447 [Paragonimus skrjabini miyazakii]
MEECSPVRTSLSGSNRNLKFSKTHVYENLRSGNYSKAIVGSRRDTVGRVHKPQVDNYDIRENSSNVAEHNRGYRRFRARRHSGLHHGESVAHHTSFDKTRLVNLSDASLKEFIIDALIQLIEKSSIQPTSTAQISRTPRSRLNTDYLSHDLTSTCPSRSSVRYTISSRAPFHDSDRKKRIDSRLTVVNLHGDRRTNSQPHFDQSYGRRLDVSDRDSGLGPSTIYHRPQPSKYHATKSKSSTRFPLQSHPDSDSSSEQSNKPSTDVPRQNEPRVAERRSVALTPRSRSNDYPYDHTSDRESPPRVKGNAFSSTKRSSYTTVQSGRDSFHEEKHSRATIQVPKSDKQQQNPPAKSSVIPSSYSPQKRLYSVNGSLKKTRFVRQNTIRPDSATLNPTMHT